jgi:hypothetical protein
MGMGPPSPQKSMMGSFSSGGSDRDLPPIPSTVRANHLIPSPTLGNQGSVRHRNGNDQGTTRRAATGALPTHPYDRGASGESHIDDAMASVHISSASGSSDIIDDPNMLDSVVLPILTSVSTCTI